MGAMASQIASLTIVYSTVCSGADQSKHQSSASLAFVWGIRRGPLIDDVVLPSLSRPTEDFDVKHRDRDDPLVSDRVNDSTK